MKAKRQRYVPRHAVGVVLEGQDGRDQTSDAGRMESASKSVSWNTSTTMLRTLHGEMKEQGWNRSEVPEIPSYHGEVEELPERPLDLGVGWWR